MTNHDGVAYLILMKCRTAMGPNMMNHNVSYSKVKVESTKSTAR